MSTSTPLLESDLRLLERGVQNSVDAPSPVARTARQGAELDHADHRLCCRL